MLVELELIGTNTNSFLNRKILTQNNHIDMVWKVLLTSMDQKREILREKLIISEKKVNFIHHFQKWIRFDPVSHQDQWNI